MESGLVNHTRLGMASSNAVAQTPGVPQHKLLTGCMLSALPCCCSCADRRPEATAYPVYIDGKGIRMQGKRWQRYCRKCCGKSNTDTPIFLFSSAQLHTSHPGL